MTAEQWVQEFARQAGLPGLDAAQMAEILRLASVAAHSSERKAAPMACWLAGTSGRPVEELLRIAEAMAPPAG